MSDFDTHLRVSADLEHVLIADVETLRQLARSNDPRVATLAAAILEEEESMHATLDAFAEAAPLDPRLLDAADMDRPWWQRLSTHRAWTALPILAAAAGVAVAVAWPLLQPDPLPPLETGTAAAVVALEDCGEVDAIEERALSASLTDADIVCLRSVDADPRARNMASRMLMTHLWHSDKSAWEAQMLLHLEEIDQSDHELLYKAALHFAKKGDHEASARWAEGALEKASQQEGVSKKRILNMHRLHAFAAFKLHQQVSGTPEEVEARRVRAAEAVQAWFTAASEEGDPPGQALAMCTALGLSETCEATE